LFITNQSKGITHAGMDAQAMLGFFKVKGIDSREEQLEILWIVEKTDVVFDIQ
jgi:hypothetical protein